MSSSAQQQPALARYSETIVGAGFKALNLPVQVSTHVIRLRRDAEIYGANEPAEYVYEVISGVVRSYKVLEGGQRQIVNFYSTGDIFGLEFGGVYSLATEAVEDCAVLVVNRHSLISAASPASSIARQLWLLTAVEVDRARQHMLFLIKTAEERLAAFLLLMAKSSTSGLEVDLAMSRQDIADYLGLTIETVSRTMTQFSKRAIIEMSTSRHIVVRNPAALKRLSK